MFWEILIDEQVQVPRPDDQKNLTGTGGDFLYLAPCHTGFAGQQVSQFCLDASSSLNTLPADKVVREHNHHTKTVVVPLICRVIVVAVRHARVVPVVVPRAAAQAP